jgi:integrase
VTKVSTCDGAGKQKAKTFRTRKEAATFRVRQLLRPRAWPCSRAGRYHDREGIEWLTECGTEREAVDHVAQHARGGLRFHDLRHSSATWLVSDGLPVNVVQRVIGHEQGSTTLNLYGHASEDHEDAVRAAFSGSADHPLTFDLDAGQEVCQG